MTRQSISNRFARCLVKRRMRFGKANRTGLRAVTHVSCVDTFNRRDEGYDHDNAEYDGKNNHDGSAGVSVCCLLRIVFHGCLPKGARNNVTWLSWFRLPGRQYARRGRQISWGASGETTDGFLHTHIANSESSIKFEIYRPNTWPPSRPTHVR